MNDTQPPNVLDRNKLRRLLTFIELMDSETKDFCTVTVWRILVRVALKPGMTSTDIGDEIGMTSQNISRIIRTQLKGRPQSSELLEHYSDPMNVRIPLYKLSGKGESFIQSILDMLYN